MSQSKFNVQDLIDRKLVTVKRYPDRGLNVLKYHKRVFWNNLWAKDSRLLDCRGTIVDNDWNIVTMPFTKVFNLHENGTKVHRDKIVTAVRKVNGFMAAATMHEGELLVSTTGTIDSDYAAIARRHIGSVQPPDGHTMLFEICDESDPHIVNEAYGAYLIGCRQNRLGSDLCSEQYLDDLSERYAFMRPDHYTARFSDVMDDMRITLDEGYMIRDAKTSETLCKVKSPYYLAKKFFMRMSKNKLESIWGDQQLARRAIDEEYYDLLEWLPSRFGPDDWAGLAEQDRKSVIEEYFKCRY